MPGSPLQNLPPAANDQRSPARDPRIRNRTGSAHVVDQNADTGRGPLSDFRESFRKGDDTPSTTTPQSPSVRLDNPLPVPNDQPELLYSFSRHIHNSQSVDFLSRKLAYLRSERSAARSDHEKVRKERDRFPVVVDQARDRVSKIEGVYKAVKQDEANARAAEEASGGKLITVLLERVKDMVEERDVLVKEKDDAHKLLTEQVGRMQQQLQTVLSQQATAAAQPPPVSNELKIQLQKLEEFRAQQESENKKFSAIHDKLRGLEEMRSELRASSKAASHDAMQAIEALKSEIESLQRGVGTLEQKLPPVESQLVDTQTLRAMERQLEEQFQQIKDASRSHQQVVDNVERLRKSMHLKVENMHGELRDDLSTIKTDLGTLSFQVLGQGEDQSKLTTRVVALEELVSPGPQGSGGLQTEIDTLKRADQDQSEKVAALDTSLEEFAERFDSLETRLAHFDATPHTNSAVEELTSFRSQLAERIMEWKSSEEKLSKELSGLQQQVKDAIARPSAYKAEVDKDLQTLKSQIADHASKRTKWEDTLEKEVKTLTANFVEQAAVQARDVKKLETEFAAYTEIWKRSETEQNRTVVEAVDKLRDEQAAMRRVLAQQSTQGLSEDERQQVQHAASLASNVQELGTQVTNVQKDLEKQCHLTVSLTQRFNNLTTDELARRMTGVVSKALPKYEKQVQKLDDQVQKLDSELQALCQEVGVREKAEGATLEVEKRLQELKVGLEDIAAKFQSSHDALAKNFAEARDKIQSQIEELQGNHRELELSLDQNDASQSTYRESTAKTLKAFETRLESIGSRNEKPAEPAARELFPNNGHKQQSGGNPLPRSTSDKISLPRKMTVDDSDDEEEDLDSSDILARFTKPPPQQPRLSSQRQSSRKSTQSGELSKRKRSLSQEETTEAEYSIKGRASKKSHR
ncbi:hypothetical protein G647_03473 [Cladophialophora carrionii CBS 160.54]|uniref:Uncharacterized protein n=1 Tax=Cladophialophora carrionii CBS 160.54 TaxID=1279043 RepID=V9DB12_9EURO|nr:uncharacterized protein G647_03473 [Cladophialophora carrionii CBS 160.54]ETI24104.1 hypothetical protein G647_03473 [Cladophialophora carrionii CBS 160.54]